MQSTKFIIYYISIFCIAFYASEYITSLVIFIAILKYSTCLQIIKF